MATAPRRRRIGHRRRVEDEGDDDGRTEALDIEEESLSEGSLLTDDDDAGEDSDTSNIDEASPTSPKSRKKSTNGMSGVAARRPQSSRASTSKAPVSDTELMLHGLSVTDEPNTPQDMNLDDIDVTPIKGPLAPVIVSSASAMGHAPVSQADRRRQEQEYYKCRREEDPAFVPKRGAFFMHDHRHNGSAAHGFRPLGRGRGRGGRGIIGGPFSLFNHISNPSDPTTSSPWTHDMHDVIADPVPRRPRQMTHGEEPPNGTGFIPTCDPSSTPINRTLSTEKHTGNAQVRVFLPHLMKSPAVFPGVPVKQYTGLPDHRPPLRRDKPVRISLPNHSPRYVFPASDRSFIFIPRALRPNQQRIRGKPRSAWSSAGGFSRRNNMLGGSYYGSVYSPSIAMSRHSSVVQERDMVFSPTGSAASRPPMPADVSRPVVRLPPAARPDTSVPGAVMPPAMTQFDSPLAVQEASISELPPPQRQSLPQKPAIQENRPASLPMHQPRPQKNISVADIESPTLAQGPRTVPLPFHQQVPLQVSNGLHQEAYVHARGPSYSSQHSTGTPLSQIPERAIHAAPFQPNNYNQPLCYNQPVYQPQAHAQQGFYYPQGLHAPPTMAASAAASPFAPAGQHVGFVGHVHSEHPASQPSVPNAPSSSSLVAQELNGMVYYYDASQIQPVNAYQPYPAHQSFQPSVMGMGGMVTPSPDGFYYPQHAQGMVYYSQ